MHYLRLGGSLTLACRGRLALFLCLTAVLCAAAGLLGTALLYGDAAFAPLSVVIVDEDGTPESRMLLRYVEETPGYGRAVRFTRAGTGSEAALLLAEGAADAAVTIPRGFVAGVFEGRNDPFLIELRGDSPLRAGLVRLFTDTYSEMLTTGQKGIYAALDGASSHSPEAWNTMYRLANLRYLSAILTRSLVFAPEELTATGGMSPMLYYGAAAFVFLLLLGCVLFLDIWAGAASRPVLLRLRALGRSPVAAGLALSAAAALPFFVLCLGLGACAAAVTVILDVPLPRDIEFAVLLPALLVLCLCAGAFLFAASRLPGVAGGAAAVFVFSLLGSFLSGGVLPYAMLSPPLRALGALTPHYRLIRLLTGALTGQSAPADFLPPLLFAALFTAIGTAHTAARSSAGKTV